MSKAFFWIRLSLTGYVSLVEQKVGVMNHPQESFWCEAVNLRNYIYTHFWGFDLLRSKWQIAVWSGIIILHLDSPWSSSSVSRKAHGSLSARVGF